VPFADPFILCEKGVCSACGTHRWLDGVGIAESTDLVHMEDALNSSIVEP